MTDFDTFYVRPLNGEGWTEHDEELASFRVFTDDGWLEVSGDGFVGYTPYVEDKITPSRREAVALHGNFANWVRL